jgi:hypothetical protein
MGMNGEARPKLFVYFNVCVACAVLCFEEDTKEGRACRKRELVGIGKLLAVLISFCGIDRSTIWNVVYDWDIRYCGVRCSENE